MKPLISLIAACGNKGALGKNNDLPWHMPADLKYFKQTTMGHPVIMGRKTFESCGSKPLPGRRNIVLSRTPSEFEGAEWAPDLSTAITLCNGVPEIFICGGAQVYERSIHLADRIYLTRIYGDFKADAWFPDIPSGEFTLLRTEKHLKDEKNPYDYSFNLYERV